MSEVYEDLTHDPLDTQADADFAAFSDALNAGEPVQPAADVPHEGASGDGLPAGESARPAAAGQQQDDQSDEEQVRLQHELSKVQRRLASDQGRLTALQKRLGHVQPQEFVRQDELAELNHDFPVIAKAVHNMQQHEVWRAQEERARIEQEIVAIHHDHEALQAQALDQARPGWRNEIARPEFAHWLQHQPPGVRALAASSDASDAMALLVNFDNHTARSAQVSRVIAQRRQQLAQSATPPTRRNPAADEVADDPEALFSHFANQLNKQRRN
ncbi:hypothetical protein SAMN02745857_02760 [Andreprevotia lacus DSM 23236]|jgi:hypothetical protein|uniref:Uncharacterized protein n=1 Tax=Andreprevotia lacus DSM 23236 TaxID=1121001 RepID=A0A1W1XTD8_9NEIS|nr:hypothetical protein [Andreprevotia lacus]SMC27229.1 hypothetical protein SAMN02745857_02760 [Andreprevotia lacus DSM 23236]